MQTERYWLALIELTSVGLIQALPKNISVILCPKNTFLTLKFDLTISLHKQKANVANCHIPSYAVCYLLERLKVN